MQEKSFHPVSQSKRKRRRPGPGLLILMSLLLLLPLSFFYRYMQTTEFLLPPPKDETATPLLLSDSARYDEITWLCAHNAMNNREEGWLLPNQNWSIFHQLENGVHAQMWDVWKEKGEIILRHGSQETTPLGTRPLEGALKDVLRYIESNPRAIITLFFESYVSAPELRAAFEKTGADAYCYKQAKNAPWPTLGQLRKARKRLIIFTDKPDQTDSWLMSLWDHCVETPWQATSPDNLSDEYNRGKAANRLFIVNHFITNPIAMPSEARKINSRDMLRQRLERLQKTPGRLPQFLTVDFTDIGDCLPFIHENAESRHLLSLPQKQEARNK